MKRLHFTLAFALLAGGASYATTINYDTAATVFGCTNVAGALAGCGTNEVTIGSSTDAVVLLYQASTSSVDASPITFTNLGSLVVGCLNGGTACSSENLSGITLNLEINQSVPGPTTPTLGLITGALAGSVSGSASGGFITFGTGASVQLTDGVVLTTYAIQGPFLSLPTPSDNTCLLNCPASPAGSTTIQGVITALPEPEISLLVASGLVAIGTFRRRRK
jgi:hypothetical protein